MGEEKYYPIVREWLEKEKGYYCGGFIEDSQGKPMYFQNKGTRLRIDVAGIKNVGSSVEDEVEVVAVEVRDVDNIQLRDIQDAQIYSQYAHKCYLATTGIIDEQDIEDARKLGVGLLEIKDKRVKEVLGPQIKQPQYAQMMKFLKVLEVARCPICGCFYETYRIGKEYKSFYDLVRPRYFKVGHDHPKKDAFDQNELKDLGNAYQTRRYICVSCMNEFFPNRKDFHALYDKDEGGFVCQMGSRKHNESLVYDAGEIVEHLRDEHGIDPEVQVIKGWNNKFEKEAREHLKSKEK